MHPVRSLRERMRGDSRRFHNRFRPSRLRYHDFNAFEQKYEGFRMRLLRKLRRGVPYRGLERKRRGGRRAGVGTQQSIHHLPILRLRLPVGPERQRRQSSESHIQSLRARERRRSMFERKIRLRLHPQPRTFDSSSGQRRRRIETSDMEEGFGFRGEKIVRHSRRERRGFDSRPRFRKMHQRRELSFSEVHARRHWN